MATPTTLLGVYRGLLRQARRIPIQESREERSLSIGVASAVRREFRLPVDHLDAEALQQRRQSAFDNYFYLEKLASNELATRGRDAVPASSPDIVDKARKLLSTDAQRKISQRKWGFFDRLFGT